MSIRLQVSSPKLLDAFSYLVLGIDIESCSEILILVRFDKCNIYFT
jgi:hypothetical protein